MRSAGCARCRCRNTRSSCWPWQGGTAGRQEVAELGEQGAHKRWSGAAAPERRQCLHWRQCAQCRQGAQCRQWSSCGARAGLSLAVRRRRAACGLRGLPQHAGWTHVAATRAAAFAAHVVAAARRATAAAVVAAVRLAGAVARQVVPGDTRALVRTLAAAAAAAAAATATASVAKPAQRAGAAGTARTRAGGGGGGGSGSVGGHYSVAGTSTSSGRRASKLKLIL